MSLLPLDNYDLAVDFLKSQTAIRPKILIIAGSGLGGLANIVESAVSVNYADIPNFPRSTVAGHGAKCVFGTVGKTPVVVMCGRFHTYEGHDVRATAFPVRVFRLLGAEYLFVTNAAGGLNPKFTPGDLVVVGDHINLPGMAGKNPLVGPNDDRFGPRFPPVDKAYTKELATMAKSVASEMGISDRVHYDGVYAFVSGPNYETPHEVLFLRTIGADCVGMSTVPEVLVATHCGMKILCLSLITNKVVLPGDQTTASANHEEVLAAAASAATYTQDLVKRMIERVSS